VGSSPAFWHEAFALRGFTLCEIEEFLGLKPDFLCRIYIMGEQKGQEVGLDPSCSICYSEDLPDTNNG